MKELLVQNNGTTDVCISDLGLKVPSKKTVDIFKANPYLTEEKILLSLKNGSLYRRLKDKKLKIINKKINHIPEILNKIMVSKKPFLYRKLKSSIIIEPNAEISDNDGFDFADYGIEETKK